MIMNAYALLLKTRSRPEPDRDGDGRQPLPLRGHHRIVKAIEQASARTGGAS